MKIAFTTLAAVAALMASTPAFADTTPSSSDKMSYEATPNGGSVSKEKSQATDSNGTTTTEDTTKKVDIDKNGNKTTKVDVKDSVDPKGLMNKQTTEVQNKAVEKDGKTEYEHKKIVNGTTVEKTDDMQQPAK